MESQVTIVGDWAPVLESFLLSVSDSPHTRRAYARAVSGGLTAMHVGDLRDLSGVQLVAWREAVMRRPRAPATKAATIIAMRSFLLFCRAVGAAPISPELLNLCLRTPRATTLRPIAVLSDTTARALLAAAGPHRPLLATLLGTGLRVGELIRLNVGDLRLEDRPPLIHVREGKGGKDRLVPIRSELVAILRAHLATRQLSFFEDTTEPVFTNRAGGRLGPSMPTYILGRVAERAGVYCPVNPHVFRHTYAVNALHQGGNIVAVSKLLGHADISTTMRYLDHLSRADLLNSVPALPGVMPPEDESDEERGVA